MKANNHYRLDTQLIHLGSHPDPYTGALSVPIYQTSTFAFESAEQGGRRFAGQEPGYMYTRLGNPNHVVIEEKIAALEGGEAAVCASSGMGAIAATFWSLLKAGDHVVACKTMYGCTYALLSHGMTKFGVETTFVDGADPEQVEAAIRPNTRLLFAETPSNPTLDLMDIQAWADIAHRHSCLLIVDNTFMTPYLQKPIELGADIIVHSATKYLNGHGDVIAGFTVGSKEIIHQVKSLGIKDMTGSVLGPFEAYLIMRGLKTLPIRMIRHCENAQIIAEWLQNHPKIEKLVYPGLPSHPQYELAQRQMRMPGGLITIFVKGGFEAAKRVINQVKLCTIAVSLGDLESLIQHPASMTHTAYSAAEREEAGIADNLVRLSVGLEHPEDIIADLDQALAQA